MQRCLKLLALARCGGFLLPRAPRITPAKLRESAGDDFLESLFEEADQRVVDDTPDRPPRNYDAAPYAEHDYERAQDDDGSSVDVAAVDAFWARLRATINEEVPELGLRRGRGPKNYCRKLGCRSARRICFLPIYPAACKSVLPLDVLSLISQKFCFSMSQPLGLTPLPAGLSIILF